MNFCLYGPRSKHFALWEQSIRPSDRSPSGVLIGQSSLRWIGDALVLTLEERATPFGGLLRGEVRLRPEVSPLAPLALDQGRAHWWWPIAPLARIEVELTAPSVCFSGRGYHDANAGSAPLEDTFEGWSWSRAALDEDRAVVTYDVIELGGRRTRVAREVSTHRPPRALEGLDTLHLPRTLWRLSRTAESDAGHPVIVARELEDTPFYSRALLQTHLAGEATVALHETLSLTRLRQRWVRSLIGFRMRRR